MKKLLAILFVLFSTVAVYAQKDTDTTESIYIPDRPGYTYNAHLVGLHRMDVELGFGYNYQNYFEKTNIFYNTTYFRYGAFKWLEFRYGVEFGSIATPTYNVYGVRGVNIGFKIPILVDVKYAPEIAIIATTSLPNIGPNPADTTQGFAIPNYAPSVNLALQKCFFDKLVLFGNTGFFYDGFNPYIQYNSSLAAYLFVSQKCAVFVETMVMYSNGHAPNNMGDAGLVYYITDNIQWDLSFGVNYVKGLDNSFVNSGISWRFPKGHKKVCHTTMPNCK